MVSIFQNQYFIIALIFFLALISLITKKKKNHIPVLFFIIYFLLKLPQTISFIPENFLKYTNLASFIIIGFAFIRLSLAIVQIITKNRFEISRVMKDALLAFLYVVWALIALKTKGGINPVSFLTTSAVLTLVMGFSMQGILSNLFAGFSIQTEKPYKLGDWIECEGTIGKVLDIGWKSTRVITKQNELVVIPNQNIIKAHVKNFSKPNLVHTTFVEVGVDYDVPPDNVISTLLKTLSKIDFILTNPEPMVFVEKFGDSAITYKIRFSHNDFAKEAFFTSEVQRRVWYSLKRRGFRIPYPIRDVRPWAEMRKEELNEKEKLENKCKSAINSADIFAPLSNEDKETLANASSIYLYAKDEDIVKQGEGGSSMFIIVTGSCSILFDGKEVANLKDGNYFGEMSLLTGEKRTATVRAKTAMEVVSIDKQAITPILEKHSNIADELALALAKRQSELDKETSTKDISGNASKLVTKIKMFFGL